MRTSSPLERRRLLGAVLLASLAVSPVTLSAETSQPNILLILADDLGYSDISCFGNDRVQTPNIDRLADEGVKLTRFYAAAPVCTPTRVSILTGQFPRRFGLEWVFSDQGEFLPVKRSLPLIFQGAGYHTSHIGKWHLGGVRSKDAGLRPDVPGPAQHGFDHFLVQVEEQPRRREMINDRTLYRKGGTVLMEDDEKLGPDHPHFPRYLTDAFGEEAIDQIRTAASQERPFFLNLWFMTPHTPYEPAPDPEWSVAAAEGISEDQRRFRSMVARMDFQIGRILSTIDELGLTDDTLVLFTSDNGGAYEANNGGLKGGKVDLHEGGIRVPFVARWPGKIPAGSQSAQPGNTVDLYPTLCEVAGLDTTGKALDGTSLTPLLTEAETGDTFERPPMFWHLRFSRNHQRHTPKPKPFADGVVMDDQWKLLLRDGKATELFDIREDTFESENLLADHPDTARALESLYADWFAEPVDPFPTVK